MAEGVTTETQQTYKQHPIPQHVLGVEFKLIGGLTVRQFGLLAVFAVVAFLIYSSSLPGLIKIPIALTFGLVGAFISLVPIQDRPADTWLKNFLLAIAQPTERVWRKSPANLDVFFEMRQAHTIIKEEKTLGGPSRGREEVSQYLRSSIQEEATPLDLAENEFLKSVQLLQSDVSLPPGLAASVKPEAATATEVEESPQTFPSRQEVRVTNSLASEVNYSQEKVIPVSTAGRRPKFITPIQNIRAGRRLKLTKPLEAGLAVAGEKQVMAAKKIEAAAGGVATLAEKPKATIPPTEIIIENEKPVAKPLEPSKAEEELPSSEHLVQKFKEVSQKIEAAQSLSPSKKPSPPPDLQKAETAPSAPPPAVGPIASAEPSPFSHLAGQSKSGPAPAAPSTEAKGEAPVVASAADQETASRLSYLGEQLQKMREEKEKLQEEVEKQKKARLEAETYATLAAEYQKQISTLGAQNEKLAAESKRAQVELRQLQQAVAGTAGEKENLERQAKESQKRIEELAREKTQATDNLLGLQRELRELRLKQRFAPPPVPGAPTSPPPSPAVPKTKVLPFVKDRANIINGYIKDAKGSLLKDAVIIIKDAQGEPVRALKSNELGQFAITTPVPNGAYTVEVSRPGTTFDIMTVEVYGAILDPLEIIGK